MGFGVPEHPDGSPIMDQWPDCETPDCEAKACTWSPRPELCFPCGEKLVGRKAMIQRFNQTHRHTWEEVERDIFCGCCDRPMDAGDWCGDCAMHIIPPGGKLTLMERTYTGQTGKQCPYFDYDEYSRKLSESYGWEPAPVPAPHFCNDECRGVDNHADTGVESERGHQRREKIEEETDPKGERETQEKREPGDRPLGDYPGPGEIVT